MFNARQNASAIAFLSVLATSASAETITVCEEGCDFVSINAAIAASTDGDVIQLSAETYAERATIDTLGKAITLRGALDKAGSPASILDGGNTSDESVLDGGNPPGEINGIRVLICQSGETDATVFENLVIRNGYAVGTFGGFNGGGGMYNGGSSPTVANCIFENNQAVYGGGGMFNENGSAPTVIDCVFRNNQASRGGGMLNQFSSPTLEGCVFTGNQAFVGGGLSNFDSSPTVSNSNFCGNAVADIGFEIASQIDGDPIAGEEAGNCIAIDCDDCEEGDGDTLDTCVGDINADGFVDSADLGLIIGSWGSTNSLADLDGDGLVNSADLGIMIGAWGPCD